ncbi:PAS domain-containing sensor histidine kinase [Emticicia sp. BO119]|uniref:PAS domain-containing sensor histidine kinase n=1 Tax=Emticicia sp. BO119 TaxID=2757768 RepID=UPI0015F058A2|nr:PAS domain-containing sensor histidine kinase [Emticicia sp. BO119]MBA4848832.1 PAS domain S-box protein [Emticicia sp. BO119]
MSTKIAQNENKSKGNLEKKTSSGFTGKHQSLQELEERLNLLMVNTDECLLVVDTNLDIITCNLKFEELYSIYFGVKIIKGTSVLSYTQPERVEILRQLYTRVLGGEPLETEIQVLAPDGSVCFFLNKFKPIYDTSRIIIGAFVSSYDITANKKTEMALRQSEEKYHYIVENALDGFIFSERDGTILDANKTSCQIFGYTVEEFRKLKWHDIILYDPEIINKYREERDLNGKVRGELTCVHKSGRHFPCEFSTVFYGGSNGKNDGRISTFISDISERKRAEKEAILREKRFSSLVEHGADGVAILSTGGIPIYISPSIEKVLGYTVEESITLDLFSATHPDDMIYVQTAWMEMLSKPGVPVLGEVARIRHKDGNWRWIEGTLINMLHEPGIEGIVNNFRDVTNKILAEQEKEFERRDKEALINNTEDLIWSVSKDFRLIAGNRAFIESMRKTTGVIVVPGDFLLMSDYFDRRFIEFWRTLYSRGLSGESVKEEAFIAGLLGGENLWIEVSINPIQDRTGIIGLACYSRDITKQKELQENLVESEEKFRAAFQFSAIGMAIVGLDGRFLAVNDSLCKITGYSAEEMKTLTYRDITHPDDYEKDEKFFKELINGKNEAYQIEKRYIHKHKHIVWIHLAISLVRHKYGEPLHFVSQINDITQRKRDELHLLALNLNLNQRAEQLSASNAELEQFAYVASHDLQEPLRMITGFLTQLDKKYKEQLDDRAKQYINFAVDGASRMRTIILDLLEYSKIGRKEYELDWVNMNELVQEVVQKNIWQQEGAIIEWEDLPSIYGAKLPLYQLMQNLISNAIKYRKPNEIPKINITAIDNHKHWQFSVADNGIGIEKQFFDKIFILFQRLHHKEEYSGTGIGLAICKKIIDNHNGRIWVESEYGSGSTFHFIINK